MLMSSFSELRAAARKVEYVLIAESLVNLYETLAATTHCDMFSKSILYVSSVLGARYTGTDARPKET